MVDVYRVVETNVKDEAESGKQNDEEEKDFGDGLEYLDEHDHVDAKDVQTLKHEQQVEPGEEYGEGSRPPLDLVESVEHAKVGEGQNENDRKRVQYDFNIVVEFIPKATVLFCSKI